MRRPKPFGGACFEPAAVRLCADPVPRLCAAPAEQPDDEPPARVLVAMQYLRYATDKTADAVVPHGMGAETVGGQQLTRDEQEAMTNACSLLSTYFTGKLIPTRWEDGTLSRRRNQGAIIICPMCGGEELQPEEEGETPPVCKLCAGSKRVLVVPTTE